MEVSMERESIITLLNTIINVSENIQNKKIKDIAASNIDKLFKQNLNLVVLGQFKRGKTTVINSMLGANVLPTAVIPLTSIITKLVYSEHQIVTVKFYDGKTKEVSLEEISDYVTERNNPNNIKGVDYVEIGYPSEYLRQGIVLVDTPGIGSTFAHNTAVAYNYLPNMDAGIFVVSGDPPLSEVEYNYLDSIKLYIEKIFFLFNKIDIMTEEECRESLEFTKNLIEKKLNVKEIKIFPVSARLALQAKLNNDKMLYIKSNFREFEDALDTFIKKDKYNTLIRSINNRAINLLKDLKMEIEITINAINSPIDELREKIRLLKEKIGIIDKRIKEMQVLLEDEIKTLKTDLENDVEQFKSQASERLKAGLLNLSYDDKHKDAILQTFTNYLKQGINDECSRWFKTEEEKISQSLSQILMNYAKAVDEETNNIRTLAADLFNVRFNKTDELTYLDPYSRLWYKVDDIITWGIDNIPMVLPNLFFKNYIVKQTKKRIDEEIDRNAGRARYDLFRRIDNTKNKFIEELENRRSAVVEGIISAVTKAEQIKITSESEISERLRSLQDYMNQLETIV
jgi:GTP-binding protein EngB required for normal cell division